MKIFNRCCCCSLKTGVKLIGYYQTIIGAIVCVLLVIVLAAFLELPVEEEEEYTSQNMTMIANNAQNMTEVVSMTKMSKPQRALGAFVLVFYLTYFLFYTGLGVVLLYGIYKQLPTYINVWVKAKLVILLISLIPTVFRLFLLIFGLDSDLTKDIYMGVWDILLIAVVYSYHEEMEEIPTTQEVIL